jgi:acyl carrier protein
MTDRENLRAILVSLLEEEMGETYAPPRDEDDLRAAFGLDSVDLVGLVMRIEREFHIRLAREELETLDRVGDLLDLLERKLAELPVIPATGVEAPASPEHVSESD